MSRTAAPRRARTRWGRLLGPSCAGLLWAVACGRTSNNAPRREAAADASAVLDATEDASGDVRPDASPDARNDGDAGPESGPDAEEGTDAGCDADLMNDPNNCGACGVVCCGAGWCISGVCGCDSTSGQILCLTDAGPPGCNMPACFPTDPNGDNCHCGDCSTACKAGTACVSGQCVAVDGGTGCQQP